LPGWLRGCRQGLVRREFSPVVDVRQRIPVGSGRFAAAARALGSTAPGASRRRPAGGTALLGTLARTARTGSGARALAATAALAVAQIAVLGAAAIVKTTIVKTTAVVEAGLTVGGSVLAAAILASGKGGLANAPPAPICPLCRAVAGLAVWCAAAAPGAAGLRGCSVVPAPVMIIGIASRPARLARQVLIEWIYALCAQKPHREESDDENEQDHCCEGDHDRCHHTIQRRRPRGLAPLGTRGHRREPPPVQAP